uniref:Intraflagellar transport 88 homolog n=1 Tax=Cyprinus carpio carpio TaxID=630221 RepID=A0A9J7Y3A8_CYPCA
MCCLFQSYRYFPSNISVIEWLGAYYIDTQFCEKAIQYFERTTLIQPTQVKWQLLVASCYRISGNYQKALETYKDIHQKFPENVIFSFYFSVILNFLCPSRDIFCQAGLRFLVRLCTDMGLIEVQNYATKLKKVEKIREQRVRSGREGSARGLREGSTGSGNTSNLTRTLPKKPSGMTAIPLIVNPGSGSNPKKPSGMIIPCLNRIEKK